MACNRETVPAGVSPVGLGELHFDLSLCRALPVKCGNTTPLETPSDRTARGVC